MYDNYLISSNISYKKQNDMQFIYTRHQKMDSDRSFSSIQESDVEDQERDYEDFEQARREEVLRNLNINYESSNSKHEEVMEILEKKHKKQEYLAKIEEEKDLKKMRAKNAQKFFAQIKLLILNCLKNSINQAQQALKYAESEIGRLLSFLDKQTIQMFQKLRLKNNNSKTVKDFSQLMEKIFQFNKLEIQGKVKYKICWALAYYLKIGFGKLCFIDISNLDLQTFYNLKYKGKSKAKKTSKEIDILKNKLQRKINQQKLSEDSKNFIPIDAYSFNPNPDQQSQIVSNSVQSYAQTKDKMIRLKQTFQDCFFQIYCPVSSRWLIFNADTFEIQDIQEFKNYILEGKAIIGFYLIRLLRFKSEFSFLFDDRRFSNIELRDLTADFGDNFDSVIKRRQRLGCKSLYKNLIKDSNFTKTYQIYSEWEKKLVESLDISEEEWAKNLFPKSNKQMKLSDYYVVPSMIDKYKILKEGAQPIPDLLFNEEKVYRKRDLIRVASRMGWIDFNRMVKEGENPVKTTQTRNKKPTRLYKFTQTEPFYLKLEKETGNFILDEEYNSVYIPPNFQPPQYLSIMTENIDYICKKHGFKSTRLVQGFNLASFRIVPNNVGFLVYKEEKDKILELFLERQEYLRQKKEAKKDQKTINLWKKLFKSILITQQINN